ncbi:MAG: hypothetical protein IJ896_08835 [Fibrobacter sp.]|nr:hypothetical protein [Fibrobacter sp.]
MFRGGLWFILSLALAVFFAACSSAPRKDAGSGTQLTAADSAAIKGAVQNKEKPQAASVQNLDVAHESFIRAMEMELRGEKALAEIFWQRAYEADPESRYLSFAVAERVAAHGEDSAALVLAQRANHLKGKTNPGQYELLAKLYVKAGIADSARRYFNLALDSSRYQDMTLLYDYSLFLEAVQDKKELIRVYDLLLPQVNYISSLFQRQLNLLIEAQKDSAVVELFAKGYEATGDKKMLLQQVQGLIIQKRNVEARAIVDTLSTVSEYEENMINLVLLVIAKDSRADALAFLRKKIYTDHLESPVLFYFLANYEYAQSEVDSAKVHYKRALEGLTSKPFAAQACRALAGIALTEKKKDEAIVYAQRADSTLEGGDKDFLAMTYGFAGKYQQAYYLLDSLLGVWTNWTPMVGIADSASVTQINQEAQRNYRHLQHTYAKILVVQAQEIESDGKADSLKLFQAKEARSKANLFWESMLMGDSTSLLIRFNMAMNLERMGEYDESFKLFEYLLTASDRGELDRPELYNYYGYSLIELNRNAEELDKGIMLVDKALSLEKGKAPSEAFLDSKAWGLYRKGKFDEAYAVMQQIKSENFNDDHVYWEHMAAIQAAVGKTSDAVKSYKQLLKLRPNNATAKEFLKKHH